MTLAKSLTGAVSCGSGACARAVAREADDDPDQQQPGETPVRARAWIIRRAPATYRRIPRPARMRRCTATSSAVGSAIVLRVPAPALMTSRTTSPGMPICRSAVAATSDSWSSASRAMLRRSAVNAGADAAISRATASGSTAGFEKGFPQMNEVALRTQLARATPIGLTPRARRCRTDSFPEMST